MSARQGATTRSLRSMIDHRHSSAVDASRTVQSHRDGEVIAPHFASLPRPSTTSSASAVGLPLDACDPVATVTSVTRTQADARTLIA